jgi:Ca-activated chloride channel family protein
VTLTRPELLPLLPLALALLALAVAVQLRRRRRLARHFSAEALGRLFPERALRFPAWRLVCLALSTTGLVLAATGVAPRPAEPLPAPVPLDLAIAVDVSASMGARDGAPTRIARARAVVAGLAAELGGARTVLVIFASWPYTLVPPSDDPAVVRYFADALAVDVVLERDQGTSLAAALAHARAALASRPRPGARRAILVLSDGGAHDAVADILAEAAAAAADGVEVWTAGLGSARGAELVSISGPVLDATGVPVVASLDEDLLRRVAAAGGGRYEHVGDERGQRAIVAGLQESAGSTATRPVSLDATVLLALFALPLLLLEGALDGGRASHPRARAPRRDA